jgi:hypothetical protein
MNAVSEEEEDRFRGVRFSSNAVALFRRPASLKGWSCSRGAGGAGSGGRRFDHDGVGGMI